MFVERRRPGRPKLYHNSREQIGQQALRNQLGFMNNLGFDWSDGLTYDSLRGKPRKGIGSEDF